MPMKVLYCFEESLVRGSFFWKSLNFKKNQFFTLFKSTLMFGVFSFLSIFVLTLRDLSETSINLDSNNSSMFMNFSRYNLWLFDDSNFYIKLFAASDEE